MSRWIEELRTMAAEGERRADPPSPDDVRRQARRRKAARVAVPVAAATVMVVAGAVVLPGLMRQPLDAAAPVDADPPLSDACGLAVLDAATSVLGVEQAVGPGDGLATVVAGSNAVVQQGATLAIGVGVQHRASGVEELALVPAGQDYVVAWLVDDGGDVVGVLEPEHVTEPAEHVRPKVEVWLDGSYRPVSCGGGAAAVGEYSIVAAVALAPVLAGSDPGAAVAVLSESIPLRIDAPDPMTGLGACGSAWPEGAVESTDGHDLGLRITGGDSGLEVTGAVAMEMGLTVTSSSTEELAGLTGHPHLVIVADGTVVGETGATTDEGLNASFEPGGSIDYQGYVPLTQCGSTELLEHGTYEIYAIMSFFFESPAGQDGPEGNRTDVIAVGGPWEITID